MRHYAHDMGRKAAIHGKSRELSASSEYPTNWVEGYDEYKRFG